jgi:hypothetical protein
MQKGMFCTESLKLATIGPIMQKGMSDMILIRTLLQSEGVLYGNYKHAG